MPLRITLYFHLPFAREKWVENWMEDAMALLNKPTLRDFLGVSRVFPSIMAPKNMLNRDARMGPQPKGWSN